MLAGMEKTYADLIYNELRSVKFGQQLLPAGIEMYGMFITYETNRCILLKAELKIGESTEIYMSEQTLSIEDALNRVLPKLCH